MASSRTPQLPDINGLNLQQQIEEDYHPPIIFITGHGDISMSVRALKAGAVDFIEKPVKSEALIVRIHEALARDARQREDDVIAKAVHEKLGRLTPREREVMMLAIRGHQNKEIARRLGISHRTVELHRSRVMSKTDTATLLELASVAAAEASSLTRPHSSPR